MAERQRHVGVLGGGALGLGAALRLAQAGDRVTVIEREPHLGGLATGFRVGPSALEKFYHHIFTTDRTIIGFIREMGLENRLVWRQPNTSALAGGKVVKLSPPSALLKLPLLPLVDRLRLIAGMVLLKAFPNERFFADQTAARWVPRVMGDRVYRVIWEPVLRGKFGDRADQIAMSWLWSRVHERSVRLGYLRGGFQQLYDELGNRVRALGGDVRCGVSATAIRTADDGKVTVETSDGGAETFDQLLVTLPTRLFTSLAQGLPREFQERFPGPEHFGAHVLILALDRPLFDDVYWLNVNDRDLPFLAVVEHTNLMPPEDYGGRHLVYVGNYLPMDHPYFRQPDEDTVGELLGALPRVRPGFDPAWITEHWVFKAPFAQPIVTLDYLSKLPPHKVPMQNVFLANMAHVYPQDRGQNYSLRLGERMAELMRASRSGLAA